MEISAANASATALAATQSPGSGSAISSDFETFLKMLTAQLKNQDPLNPTKSEDFAVQLATFSGVEQQVLTNNLLESLSSQMGLMGLSQLAGWVGMEARAPVSAYFDGAPVTVAPNPLKSADSAVLVVRDANGLEVQRVPVPISNDPLQWTGTDATGASLPNGAYSFSVESFINGTLATSTTAEVYTRIVEARSSGGQTLLVTSSGAEIPATSVTGLRAPDPVS